VRVRNLAFFIINYPVVVQTSAHGPRIKLSVPSRQLATLRNDHWPFCLARFGANGLHGFQSVGSVLQPPKNDVLAV
jgi:hypothetical protein